MALNSDQLLDLLGGFAAPESKTSQVRLSYIEPRESSHEHSSQGDDVPSDQQKKPVTNASARAAQTTTKTTTNGQRKILAVAQTNRTAATANKTSRTAKIRQGAVMDQYEATQPSGNKPATVTKRTTINTKPNPTRTITTQQTGQTAAAKAIISALNQQPARPATAKPKSSITASISVQKTNTARPVTAPAQTRLTNAQAKKQTPQLSQTASALVASVTQGKSLANTTPHDAATPIKPTPQSSIIGVIQNMKKNEGIEVLKQISEYYGIRITIHDNEDSANTSKPELDDTVKARPINAGSDRKRRADFVEAEKTTAVESNATGRTTRQRMSVGAHPEPRAGGFQRILHSHLSELNQTY